MHNLSASSRAGWLCVAAPHVRTGHSIQSRVIRVAMGVEALALCVGLVVRLQQLRAAV